jgi:hypothetical protein
LEEGFRGYFSWSRPVVVVEYTEALEGEKILMDRDVQNLLDGELQKVIDWKTITGFLANTFKQGRGDMIQLNGGTKDGSERFISYIKSVYNSTVETTSTDPPLAILNFSLMSKYHTLEEVSREIEQQIYGGHGAEGGDTDLFKRLTKEKRCCLIIFQDFHLAPWHLIDEINQQVIQKYSSAPGNAVFLFISEVEIPIDIVPTLFQLPSKYTENEVYEYFVALGNSEKLSRTKAKACLEIVENHENPSPLFVMQVADIIDRRFY